MKLCRVPLQLGVLHLPHLNTHSHVWQLANFSWHWYERMILSDSLNHGTYWYSTSIENFHLGTNVFCFSHKTFQFSLFIFFHFYFNQCTARWTKSYHNCTKLNDRFIAVNTRQFFFNSFKPTGIKIRNTRTRTHIHTVHTQSTFVS